MGFWHKYNLDKRFTPLDFVEDIKTFKKVHGTNTKYVWGGKKIKSWS